MEPEPSFAEWVSTSKHIPCLRTWGSRLNHLNLSWHTFHRDRDEVAGELVQEGIPLRAARDICKAVDDVFRRQAQPLCVLWDLRTIPLISGLDVPATVARIRRLIVLYGKLSILKVYLSQGTDQLPLNLRNQFRAAGCFLVDCSSPSGGGRSAGSIIDTILAVDAMRLAVSDFHDGTLCFITNEPGYSHILQGVKHVGCKSILLSDAEANDFHAHTDVILPFTESVASSIATSLTNDLFSSPAHHLMKMGSDDPPGSPFVSPDSLASDPFARFSRGPAEENGSQNGSSYLEVAVKRRGDSIFDDSRSEMNPFENEWRSTPTKLENNNLTRRVDKVVPEISFSNKDLLLLWNAVEMESRQQDSVQARKSSVGARLKSENPVRFRDRENLKSFFRNAVSRGYVEELGSGPEIELRIPSRLSLNFGDTTPVEMNKLPFGLAESARTLPYLAFVNAEIERHFTAIQGAVMFAPVENWKILGFDRKVKIIIAAQNFPWLNSAHFVDWHSVENRQNRENFSKPTEASLLPFGVPPEDTDVDESGTPASTSLYVTSYGVGTTPNEVKDLFSKFVPVQSVVPKLNSAYMFVNTSDLGLAVKARQSLEGAELNGSAIQVKYCKH